MIRSLRETMTLAILLLSGCGGGEPLHASIYDGVWAGSLGADTFVFQFNEGDQDRPGIIHCLRNGRKYSELPMTLVTWEPPQVEAFMGATGVTYSGTLEGNRMTGELSSAVTPSVQLDLELADPADLPGLAALEGEYSYSPPADLDDGIAVGSCEDHGIPPVLLEELVNRIASGEAGLVHSILVMSQGELVLEQYFHGYTAEDLHRTMSVTKSISSLLVGIAVDRGLVAGENEPLCSFIPGFREDILLSHLLTMSMGMDWTDSEAETVHRTGEEFFAEMAERSASAAPGTGFRYVNPDVNLLSGVIRSATGLYPDEFAEECLFGPLGIEEYDWSFCVTGGHLLMDGALHLRPRDMARIGLLVMNGGTWNGLRVVSEEWLQRSTEAAWRVDDVFSYGYLWWLTQVNGSRVILASGWGSQFIVVIPDEELVIVTTGGNEDNGMNWEVLHLAQETLLQQGAR